MFNVLIIAANPAVLNQRTDILLDQNISIHNSFYFSTKNLLPDKQGIKLLVIYATGLGEKAWKACYNYRTNGGVLPIILVSERVTLASKTISLQVGIDENIDSPDCCLHSYIKAFSIRPFIRRNCIVEIENQNILVNLLEHSVLKEGNLVSLTPTENMILEFLAKHRDRIYNAGELIELLWTKPESVYEETIRCHIKNLRKKLDTKSQLSSIETITGQGYRFGGGHSNSQESVSLT